MERLDAFLAAGLCPSCGETLNMHSFRRYCHNGMRCMRRCGTTRHRQARQLWSWIIPLVGGLLSNYSIRITHFLPRITHSYRPLYFSWRRLASPLLDFARHTIERMSLISAWKQGYSLTRTEENAEGPEHRRVNTITAKWICLMSIFVVPAVFSRFCGRGSSDVPKETRDLL